MIHNCNVCLVLFMIMLNVIMISSTMLSVFMLSVILPRVMALKLEQYKFDFKLENWHDANTACTFDCQISRSLILWFLCTPT